MMEFKKAERKQAKLRLAIASPSGGGKTFSALLIAKGIGGLVAMIDTEHGSGSLYANTPGMPEYAVLELGPPFSPQRYIEAIAMAEKAGFETLIIDSLSHAWVAEGGVLDMQETARQASKSGNSWTAWREVTPWHNKLVEAMLQSNLHIIANMRSKQEHAQVIEDGKTTIKKLGLAPVQREGMDYEFTVVLDLSMEHIATASKDRTSLFDGLHFKPTAETGQKLLAWLNQGKSLPISPAGEGEKLAKPSIPVVATPSPLTERGKGKAGDRALAELFEDDLPTSPSASDISATTGRVGLSPTRVADVKAEIKGQADIDFVLKSCQAKRLEDLTPFQAISIIAQLKAKHSAKL